jgi:hypothetical protein
MALRAAARAGAVAAGLVLACWHGPRLAPELPLAVIPFDPYGGAVYLPGVVNGDSAWLMLDTGLSRTGLARDWAATIHAVPVAPRGQVADTASAADVDTLRLGDLALPDRQLALYPLRGLMLLIDGRAVAGANLSDVRTLLRVDGVVRRLVLRRDSDTLQVALKLRRLL